MRVDKLLFLHIPKTAGTSVHNVLHRHFKKHEQVECNIFINKNLPVNLTEEQRRLLKLLRGHFPFGEHVNVGAGSFEYCTMLREPVDRVVSHYYYMMTRQKMNPKAGGRIMKGSLMEVCAAGDFLFVDNAQVRFLSGNNTVPVGAVTSEMMEEAWENLNRHFPVTGIQEEFDAFILLLCDRYALRHPWYRKQRVNPNRMKLRDIDDATRKAVEERNVHDKELYRRVHEKVMKEIEGKGPGFRKRIDTFKRRNALLTGLMNFLPFTGKVAGPTD